MRVATTWIVGGAVALLLVVAIADAIRSREDASGSPAPPPAVLHGVIVAADESCRATGFRLPSMAAERPAHPLDCGGRVWSQDGTLVASCEAGVTSVSSSDGSFRLPDVRGCAPQWRADGSLSVIRDGEIVIARRHGPPFRFFTRSQLASELTSTGVENADEWKFAQVSWFGLTSFVAILQKPGDSSAAVFAQGGLETFLPHLGTHIEGLRASPIGNFAYARVDPQREYVMVSRGGDVVGLPAVREARAIAWSPDELYVAISTDNATVVARTGTTQVIATLPFGARALAWLT